MAWRVAESLLTLREQVNKLSPNRKKDSDGTIGNAEHATRSSDHNPWLKDGKMGIVTAMDLTDDEGHGIDSRALGEVIRLSKDPRVKYIIADGQIANAASVTKRSVKYAPWAWSPYTGKNSHHHHVHISVQPQKALYDDASAWDLSRFDVTQEDAAKPVTKSDNPVLAKGTKGADVERLQKLLIAAGYELTADADFGPKTDKVVRAFQKAKSLVVDGRVGPATWEALGA